MTRGGAFALAAILALLWAPAHAAGGMTYHSGPVMRSTTTYVIFWLPEGAHYQPDGNDAAFERIITQFFKDVGGTRYYSIVTEYSKVAGATVANGPIGNRSTFGGSYLDTTPYPVSRVAHEADIETAIGRAMRAKHWTRSIDHEFYLITSGIGACVTYPDAPGESCSFKQSSTSATQPFCGTGDFVPAPGGAPLLFGLSPLGPQNPCAGVIAQFPSTPNHDPYADLAVAGLAGQLFSAITNPVGTGWYETHRSNGIVDKCSAISPLPHVVKLHRHSYLLPALWSNRAHACVYAPKAGKSGV